MHERLINITNNLIGYRKCSMFKIHKSIIVRFKYHIEIRSINTLF